MRWPGHTWSGCSPLAAARASASVACGSPSSNDWAGLRAATVTPAARSGTKIKKDGDGGLHVDLVQTTDVLATLVQARTDVYQVLVGFAAETPTPDTSLLELGRAKLTRKSVDLIVANDISQEGTGFDSDLNAATLISPEGEETFPTGSKTALASCILDRAERLLARVSP